MGKLSWKPCDHKAESGYDRTVLPHLVEGVNASISMRWPGRKARPLEA